MKRKVKRKPIRKVAKRKKAIKRKLKQLPWSKKPFVVSDKNFADLKRLSPEQVIHAHKVVRLDGQSVHFPNAGFVYTVGSHHKEAVFNTNPNENCGAGLNVATREWCKEKMLGRVTRTLLVVQFKAQDIVCIPTYGYGKFRVSQLTVLSGRLVSYH